MLEKVVTRHVHKAGRGRLRRLISHSGIIIPKTAQSLAKKGIDLMPDTRRMFWGRRCGGQA